MDHRRLFDLDFVDLYICLDQDMQAYYQAAEKGTLLEQQIDVPDSYASDIKNLAVFLRATMTEDEKGLTYDGMRLRASKVRTAGGHQWVAMRRIADAPPLLNDLGYPPYLLPVLRDLGLRDGGLILLCGATGQGKTTTATSLLSDYLVRLGGVALTIEDPVEYDLEGRHGKSGVCYQVEVKEDEEWSDMLKRSLRWHPRYIMVGEVRTPDAANQLLRAATSGHLVITTLHSGSVEEAMEGLLQLAEQAVGNRAPSLLAASLTAVIHQTLGPHGLLVRMVTTEPNNLGDPCRAAIRERRIGHMTTFIDQQMARLMHGQDLYRSGTRR